MTQRNVKEDIEHVMFLGHADFYSDQEAYDDLYNTSIYWIKEAEAQRIRAEATEQERDKLLAIVQNVYGKAINDLNRWEGGMTVGTPVFQDRVFVKHLVRDLQPFIFSEGSKPDVSE